MSIDKTFEAIKQLNINNVWLGIYCFVAVIAPGVLVIFCLKPEYIENLTTPKLLIFSLSILSPIFIASLLAILHYSFLVHERNRNPDSADFISSLKLVSKHELLASVTLSSIGSYLSIFLVMIAGQVSFKAYYLTSIFMALCFEASVLLEHYIEEPRLVQTCFSKVKSYVKDIYHRYRTPS